MEAMEIFRDKKSVITQFFEIEKEKQAKKG